MSIVKAVKGRIACEHSAFERSNGLGDKVNVDLVRTPGFLKELYVFWVRLDALRDSVERVCHFDRIGHGSLGLLLETRGTAIPELQGVVGGIDYCGRVASACFFADADRDLVFIGKSKLRCMAGRTGDRAIHGELRVVIKPATESNGVFARGITRRDRYRREAKRSLDLNRPRRIIPRAKT